MNAGVAKNELGCPLDLEHAMGLIGSSAAMARLRTTIQKVALSPSTDAVLISGPTGSGKELVARAVHSAGRYAKERFYAINCSAVPENLFEAELFGHGRGAFTHAEERQGALKSVRCGPCSWTRLARCPSGSRPSCCGPWRTGAFSAWVPTRRPDSREGWSPPPTRTSNSASPGEPSGRTSGTG